MVPMTHHDAIRRHRERIGASQEACARLLDVSIGTWCNYERRLTCPDVVTAQRMALLLGATIQDLWPADEEAS